MTKFIAQLREIFLMQMSLDIKHAEARNTSQFLELGWPPYADHGLNRSGSFSNIVEN